MFIEGKNLVKKYGKGEATVFALDHTEFGIEKGEIVVILGPSGSVCAQKMCDWFPAG